jgi:GNAT superfamily N-acetyltransferase
MTEGLAFRRLTAGDAGLLGQIDRSETVTRLYFVRDGELRSRTANEEVPRWSMEPDDAHPSFNLEFRAGLFRSRLARGGIGIGVFDKGVLVAYCVLQPALTETMAQVAELFVSRSHRRTGIGAELMRRMAEAARDSGAGGLYVSAARTESAVNFYLKQGFLVTPDPHPELLALEPEDIHMIKDLS